MRWLIADSLYCPEQFFCSHLSSYSWFLREAGEDAESYCLNYTGGPWTMQEGAALTDFDVVFALDRYDRVANWPLPSKKIAQVAAICDPMPWNVRKPDGSPAYDLIISSIPAMVDEARARGCRAEYLPLAFDTRARVCGMGVKRDLDCIFIGSQGPSHRRRTELLRELSDVVTVLPPVFGRQMFATLARAKVVWSAHAEWSRGAANCMRLFESAGMGAAIVSDGIRPGVPEWPRPFHFTADTAADARYSIKWLLSDAPRAAREVESCTEEVLRAHTYETRIARLLELARSL